MKAFYKLLVPFLWVLVALPVYLFAAPIQQQHAKVVARKNAAGAPFQPSDLAGLQLDINPELESGADGSAKATLTDQSGNGRTLTAAGSPNPTIEHGECNGKKIIKKLTTQYSYRLASDYSVTDFTLVFVGRVLADTAQYLTSNDAGTTAIRTDRTADGDYFRTTIGAGQDSYSRGLRSSSAWGAYMIQQDGVVVRMYDAGEICPQMFGTGTGTNTTIVFKRILGTEFVNETFEMARLLLWNRALSHTECRQLGDYIFDQYAVSPKSLFVAEGNSYTVESAGALAKSILVNHKDDIDVFHVGTAGHTIAQVASDYTTQVQPLYAPRRPVNIVAMYEFTNTLSGVGNLAATLSAYWDYCDDVRADGFKMIAVTPTAWEAASNPSTVEAGYQALWPLMRDEWDDHADALADPAALAQFDDLDDTADTTYYNADGLHLNATGYGNVADLVENEVEALLP